MGAYPKALTKLLETSYVDRSLEPNTTYLYHLRAGNAGGESETITLGVATKPAKPKAPAELEATLVTPTTVTLNWQHELLVNAYKIERAEEGRAYVEIAYLTGDKAQENAYADRSPKPATSYQYRVTALNDTGASEAAEVRTSTASVLTSPTANAVSNLLLEGTEEGSLSIGNKTAIRVVNGHFSYGLSEPRPDELESINRVIGPGSCESSDSSAALVLAQVSYKASKTSAEQSVIVQSIDAKLHLLGAQHLYAFVYANKDVSLKGLCFGADGTFNLSKGWNVVWHDLAATYPTPRFESGASTKLPYYFRWQLSE